MLDLWKHLFARTCVCVAGLGIGLVLPGSATALAEELETTRLQLPKGPGSIAGLGRDYVPSPVSGTVSYAIPIVVPPGSAGLAPDIVVDYDSGAGDSELGVGWSFGGLPSVRRRTTEGLPRFDASDEFEVVGFGPTSPLVPTSDGRFLRPEHDAGAFVRLSRSQDGDRWEARDRKGRIYRFGGAGAVESEGRSVARWLLTEQLDAHGHRIRYEWNVVDGCATLRGAVWNDFAPEARAAIEIDYARRPDVTVSFASGIRRACATRPVALRVLSGERTLRTYRFAYQDGMRTRLAGIRMVGEDGNAEKPGLRFDYTDINLNAAEITLLRDAPGRSPAEGDAALVDLDGDALPDFLFGRAGAYVAYKNRDGRSFQPPNAWSVRESPSVSLGEAGSTLADFDGDGALDLVVRSGIHAVRYLPGDAGSHFGVPIEITTAPNLDFDDPDVKLADIDGDRRIDFLSTTSSGLAVAYNRSGLDFSIPELGAIDPREAIRFSSGQHALCDVNGDGVIDVCSLRSGAAVYWLGRGRAAFEPAAIAQGVPTFASSDPFQFADLNGDGWIDLVRIGVRQVEFALAEEVGSFGSVQRVEGTPERGPRGDARLVDMNGSGTLDVLWVDTTAPADRAWQYLELAPAGRPGLLARVVDEHGLTTTFDYEPAALAAARARERGQAWSARMNVATQVVRRVTRATTLGDPEEVEEFDYVDGTWSRDERCFAGFAGAERREIGDDATPTLVTRSRFDLGLEQRGLRGRPILEERADGAGAVFTRTEFDYAVRTTASGLEQRPIRAAFLSREDVWTFERGEEGRLARTEWEQDDHGNVIEERRWGEFSQDNPLVGGDEMTIVRTFAEDPEEWSLGHIASEETRDGAGHRVALAQTYYDGEPFVGLPLGRVQRGAVSRRQEWVSGDHFELAMAAAYDTDGNMTELRDGALGVRRFEWDPVDRTFPIAEHVVVNDEREVVARAAYDRGWGAMIRSVDWNGSETVYAYDAFGRLSTVVRPGDDASRPTVRYRYVEESPLSRVLTESRRISGQDAVDVREELFDGAGRARGTLVLNPSGKAVLSDVAVYDARGEVRHRPGPRFFEEGADLASACLARAPGVSSIRDALGRETSAERATGIVTRTEYAPWKVRWWNGAQADASSDLEHTPQERQMDGRGRLVAISEQLGGRDVRSTFVWDTNAQLLERVDPDGVTSRYEVDGRGRRTRVLDRDAGEHRFEYDQAGRQIAHTYPDGVVRRSTYDRAGRPLAEDRDGDGSFEITRSWDSQSPGRLAALRDESGTLDVEHDARGRVITERRTIEGNPFVSGMRYDAQDRLIAHVYPDGTVAQLLLDARGAVGAIDGIVEVERDADGAPRIERFQGGVETRFDHDADRRLSETITRSPQKSVLQHLRWSYGGDDAILQVEDRRAGIAEHASRSGGFQYDNLGRLVVANEARTHTTWQHSPSGNLLQRTSERGALDVTGAIDYDAQSLPHAPRRWEDSDLVWDARGRLLDDGVRQYEWGADDRVRAVRHRSGARVESTWDALGERRVARAIAPDGARSTTLFLDDWSEVRNGRLVRYAVLDGARVARLDPVAPPAIAASTAVVPPGLALLVALGMVRLRRRAHALVPGAVLLTLTSCSSPSPSALLLDPDDAILLVDRVGSITEVVSARGEHIASFRAHAYGATREDSTVETRRYAGLTRDSLVGIDMQSSRLYVPELEMWATPDPVAIEDPARASAEFLVAAPLYRYAAISPLSRVDPDGAWVLSIAGFVSGSRPLTGPGGSYQVGVAIEFDGLRPVTGALFSQASGGAHAGTGGVSGGVTVGVLGHPMSEERATIQDDFAGFSKQFTASAGVGPRVAGSVSTALPSGAIGVSVAGGVGIGKDVGAETAHTTVMTADSFLDGARDVGRAMTDFFTNRMLEGGPR